MVFTHCMASRWWACSRNVDAHRYTDDDKREDTSP